MRNAKIVPKLRQLSNVKPQVWFSYLSAWLQSRGTSWRPCLLPNAQRVIRVPARDFYQSYQYFSENEDGRREIAYFTSRLRPNDVLFDIGGFRGAYAIGAKACFPQTLFVVVFEPVVENAKRVEMIVSMNDLDGVDVNAVAVGDGRILTGVMDQRNGMLRSGGSSQDRLEFAATTLDQFVLETDITPSIVKIDVEGYELEVIRGARECLARNRPRVWLELHPELLTCRGSSERAVIGALTELKYQITEFVDSGNATRSVAYHLWAEASS